MCLCLEVPNLVHGQQQMSLTHLKLFIVADYLCNKFCSLHIQTFFLARYIQMWEPVNFVLKSLHLIVKGQINGLER